MSWLVAQLWPLLLLSAVAGASSVLVLGTRRVTVERLVETAMPSPRAEASMADLDELLLALAPEPVAKTQRASLAEHPFPLYLVGGRPARPWEAEELWSRPVTPVTTTTSTASTMTAAAAAAAAAVAARAEPTGPLSTGVLAAASAADRTVAPDAEVADEWQEAAASWRTWASETAASFADGARSRTKPSDAELFAADRERHVDDRDLFAADRSPRVDDHELFAADRAADPVDAFPYARPVDAAPASGAADAGPAGLGSASVDPDGDRWPRTA